MRLFFIHEMIVPQEDPASPDHDSHAEVPVEDFSDDSSESDEEVPEEEITQNMVIYEYLFRRVPATITGNH